MDLLCTESIVTHSELSLYRYKKQAPAVKNITKPKIKYNSFSESISCSSACFSTIKKCSTSGSAIVKRDPAESVNVPIACNMSNLMYVLSSVATPISATKSTKQPQQRKSTSCQILSKLCPHRQCNINTSWMCTAVKKGTDEADDKHFAYENAHMIVTDPIFKTDRCLKNALKSEENHEQILGTHFNTVQKDITPAMRKIVAQWMMEVSRFNNTYITVEYGKSGYINDCIRQKARSIRLHKVYILIRITIYLGPFLCRSVRVMFGIRGTSYWGTPDYSFLIALIVPYFIK